MTIEHTLEELVCVRGGQNEALRNDIEISVSFYNKDFYKVI